MSTAVAKKPGSTKEEFLVIPDKVIVKPFSVKNFRLGLENTKEKFARVPGVKYRWAPDKKGDRYLTGLQFISKAKRNELEESLGKRLDDDFYRELVYIMDGSNPNGHHMDLENPFELVVFLAFQESSLVATSRTQHTKGQKPFAEWYIENDEVEAEEQEKERDTMIEVIELYNSLTNTRRATYAKLMDIKVEGLSPKVASAKLWERLMTKDKITGKVFQRFLALSKWGDERIAVAEEVEDAINVNLIRKNAALDYIYGNDVMGSTKDQVVSKLMAGENSGLRMTIKNQLLLK